MVSKGKIEKGMIGSGGDRIAIRVPAGGYIMAGFVGSFFSALSIYLGLDILGFAVLVLCFTLLPALALTDRIVFNSKRIYRSGLLPKAWAYVLGRRFWLKIRDVEQVETLLLPLLKRGGRVYFKYNTSIRGKGVEFNFSSRGREYRRFAGRVFSLVPEEVLDAASAEVRDYADEPKMTRRLAKQSNIPPADVLEHSFRKSDFKLGRGRTVTEDQADSAERAGSLRLLGNKLRLSGSLLQAMESFRRAASLCPNDAWLLFDFARCIQTFAGADGDAGLERKAAAMMRLAERRAGNDGRLLASLGESYLQLGESKRSKIAFMKAVEAVGEQFRSIRGMAEIALRDGKLAHVVHNFSVAARLAESPAARRWSEAEADYFSRLSNDDEYMDMEIGRVNLLDTLERWRRPALRLCMLGLPIIGLGVYFDDATTANCGWVLSGVALLVWTVVTVGLRAFTSRISPELLEED